MQIVGLSQCFSCQEMVKMALKREALNVIRLVTSGYETCSFFSYLRPTLMLVDYTRVMRGTL